MRGLSQPLTVITGANKNYKYFIWKVYKQNGKC